MELDEKDLINYSNLIKIDLRKINFTDLILYPQKYLKKESKYLILCEYGIKSKKVSKILNNMGYETFYLKKYGPKNKD